MYKTATAMVAEVSTMTNGFDNLRHIFVAPDENDTVRQQNPLGKISCLVQESTLLGVVTKQNQGVDREQSRKSHADQHERKNGPGAVAPNPWNFHLIFGA